MRILFFSISEIIITIKFIRRYYYITRCWCIFGKIIKKKTPTNNKQYDIIVIGMYRIKRKKLCSKYEDKDKEFLCFVASKQWKRRNYPIFSTAALGLGGHQIYFFGKLFSYLHHCLWWNANEIEQISLTLLNVNKIE